MLLCSSWWCCHYPPDCFPCPHDLLDLAIQLCSALSCRVSLPDHKQDVFMKEPWNCPQNLFKQRVPVMICYSLLFLLSAELPGAAVPDRSLSSGPPVLHLQQWEDVAHCIPDDAEDKWTLGLISAHQSPNRPSLSFFFCKLCFLPNYSPVFLFHPLDLQAPILIPSISSIFIFGLSFSNGSVSILLGQGFSLVE